MPLTTSLPQPISMLGNLALKTGQYYLRSRPARDAIKFTLNIESLLKNADKSSLFDHMNTRNMTQAEMD
jgi:hypothetical protein